MLSKKVRKRIKERKWDTYSNKSKFFNDISIHVESAFSDLKLVADNFPPEKFQEIFTVTRLTKLIISLLEPKRYQEILKLKNNNKLREDIQIYEETILNFCLLILINTLNQIEKYIDDPIALTLFEEHKKPLHNTLHLIFSRQLSMVYPKTMEYKFK